tara:strand:- start:343 stop:903 length:561 start_codon:yes stop_codon:yes gene_type:complete
MRVISGVLKGRSINFLKNKNTRPLKDSVKESVFNILKHSNLVKTKIENSNVLDLYSGIGSFGIECISRGANKITFVEKDINATEILKSNLVKLSIFNKTKIYSTNIENFLTADIVDKFNIFFLDPPFSDIKFLKILELIKKRKIYKKDYIVIIHREGKSEDKLDDLLKIIETKQYGRSKIIFGLFN